MRTLKDLAIAQGYKEKEQEFIARGLATPEEISRIRENRELSERYGIEITN